MHGYGIITYPNGVTYEGQLKADKKAGFGIYKWADGRKYEGCWAKGKQHGIGSFEDPAKQTIRFGLWENGKRIKWFNESEVNLINRQ
jgi:hypothetical protein